MQQQQQQQQVRLGSSRLSAFSAVTLNSKNGVVVGETFDSPANPATATATATAAAARTLEKNSADPLIALVDKKISGEEFIDVAGSHRFRCNVDGCEKTFSRREHLKRHLVIHGGEKQFACPVCAKSFNRNDNLAAHLHVHSPMSKKNLKRARKLPRERKAHLLLQSQPSQPRPGPEAEAEGDE
jgi:uncharacterized Zn-finger protein